MFAKIFILYFCVSLSYSYRKYFDGSDLKSEIQKYKTNECLTDGYGENDRRKKHKFGRDRSGRFGLDFGRGYNTDQFGSDSNEDDEYHPNPFLYVGDRNVGFDGAFGDNLDGYIPQDMRNARRQNDKTFKNKYSYSRQGSLRSFNTEVGCISQCIFTNMDIMEEDGTPSESLMIRWSQDQIKNERKKHSALKDIRRCFHSVPRAAQDDGCEYSKYIGECLKLDLEETY